MITDGELSKEAEQGPRWPRRSIKAPARFYLPVRVAAEWKRGTSPSQVRIVLDW
jgi:hypothetical protein